MGSNEILLRFILARGRLVVKIIGKTCSSSLKIMLVLVGVGDGLDILGENLVVED